MPIQATVKEAKEGQDAGRFREAGSNADARLLYKCQDAVAKAVLVLQEPQRTICRTICRTSLGIRHESIGSTVQRMPAGLLQQGWQKTSDVSEMCLVLPNVVTRLVCVGPLIMLAFLF